MITGVRIVYGILMDSTTRRVSRPLASHYTAQRVNGVHTPIIELCVGHDVRRLVTNHPTHSRAMCVGGQSVRAS